MAKTMGAVAVADRPTEALWLAALPTPRITVPRDHLAPLGGQPADGVLSGLPAAVTDMALSRDGRFLVAAHYGADALTVIDTATLRVHAVVERVAEPGALAVSDRIYVSSAGIEEDGVLAVDLLRGTPLAGKQIDAHLRGLAVSPTGDTLFVARCGDTVADIAMIDIETGVLTSIPVSPATGTTTDMVDTVEAVRISADGSRLFASLTTEDGAAVVVIDVRTRRVRRTISVPGSIGDIAVHRDGRKVFAASWDETLGGVLTVIDPAAGRVVDTIAVDGLVTQVMLTATDAYLLCGEDIIVVKLANLSVVDTINVGRTVSCMAVDPDGTRLYIADFDGNVEAREIAGARLRASA